MFSQGCSHHTLSLSLLCYARDIGLAASVRRGLKFCLLELAWRVSADSVETLEFVNVHNHPGVCVLGTRTSGWLVIAIVRAGGFLAGTPETTHLAGPRSSGDGTRCSLPWGP